MSPGPDGSWPAVAPLARGPFREGGGRVSHSPPIPAPVGVSPWNHAHLGRDLLRKASTSFELFRGIFADGVLLSNVKEGAVPSAALAQCHLAAPVVPERPQPGSSWDGWLGDPTGRLRNQLASWSASHSFIHSFIACHAVLSASHSGVRVPSPHRPTPF